MCVFCMCLHGYVLRNMGRLDDPRESHSKISTLAEAEKGRKGVVLKKTWRQDGGERRGEGSTLSRHASSPRRPCCTGAHRLRYKCREAGVISAMVNAIIAVAIHPRYRYTSILSTVNPPTHPHYHHQLEDTCRG
jgi:hypothetical protein